MDIKNSEVNLESEYKEFLRKNKKEYGTIKNYVRFIKPKYLKNISNYNPNINIYNISDLDIFQNIKDNIVNSDNYKDINKESSYSISSSLNQYEVFLKERQSSPTTIKDNNKVDLENEYRKFLKSEPNLGGSGTVDKYVGILRNTTLSKLSYFKETKNNEIYSISDINIFKDTVKNIKNSTNYKEVNSEQNHTLSSSLNYYEKFLLDTHRKHIDKPHQRIFFGAPGTGKSYLLNEEAKECFEKECCERVTFHPNYMYGNFVGAFKPFPKKIDEQREYNI